MDISWFIVNAVSALLLPPLVFIIPIFVGFSLSRRWPRFSVIISILPLIALVVFSTGVGAKWLAASIENRATPLVAPKDSGAQAIVVLGGGRTPRAPEFGGHDSVNLATLGRLRYGAKLHRETGLSILVTGGMPEGAPESEAALMARALQDDFSVTAKWQEGGSDNTEENARFSAYQLKQAGVQRILLVTDAMHMARSQAIFTKSGLHVIPAPTVFYSRGAIAPIDFVPSGKWLHVTSYAMHEWLGLGWYWLRHGSRLL